MTLIGFKNIPFTVNVAMHAAIHAVHYVNLNNGGDGRLTFPGGGTNMIFTPLNALTPQPIVVNFNGVGDAELLADITNDYFVNGAGEHRSKRFIIDLSVTALPLDTWTGSHPGLTDGGVGGGNLVIHHQCIATGHQADFNITAISGQINDIGFVSHDCRLKVTKPDNSTVIIANTNAVGVTMDQLGIWKFEVGALPGVLTAATPGTRAIQSSQWGATFADTGATATSSVCFHQGVVYLLNTSFPTIANGAFSVQGIVGIDSNQCVGAPTLSGGTVSSQSNCTGCSFAFGSGTASIAGTRINSPFTMSAGGTDVLFSIGGVGIANISVSVSG